MRYLLMITLFLISCDAPKNNFGYVSIDDEKVEILLNSLRQLKMRILDF